VVLKKTFALRQIIPYLLVLIIGLFLFKSTITSASIYGDEWFIFWIGKSALFNNGNILHLNVGYIPYVLEIVVFESLSRVFGYQSWPYYLLSFLTRLLVAFTLLWFLRRMKLNRAISSVAALLFIISPIGLEATDWVRNFDSYLGLFFLIILLNLSSRLKSLKDVLVYWILFIVAVFINTLRSPGLFIILLSSLGIHLISEKTKAAKKVYTYSSLALLVTIAILSITSVFGSQTAQLFENFSLFPFAKSIMGSIGTTIVPSRLLLLNFLSISFLLFLWKRRLFLTLKNINTYIFSIYIISVFFITLQIFQKGDSFTNFGLIGIFFVAVLVLCGVKEYFSKDFPSLQKTMLVFLLSFSPMLIPLIRIPQIHPLNEHRYLIYSALVVPLLVAFSLEKGSTWKGKYRNSTIVLALVATGILIMNFWGQSKSYLERQIQSHGSTYTNKVWSQMEENLKGLDLNRQKVGIILLTKKEYEPQVFNSIYFGFGFHAGVTYNIWDQSMLPPSWLIVDEQIDKSKIPSYIISPDRKIVVLEIIGDKVARKDLKF